MKVIKKISIAVGVLIAIILLAGGIHVYKYNSVISKMYPNDTKEIVEGIYAIKDDTFINMYFVKSGNNYVAVDAAKNPRNLEKKMKKLNIEPERVTNILLTHTDLDHIGAIKLFKNAKVYIASAEEQMINGKTARTWGVFKNKLDSPYEMIEDGQIKDISGLKVKGILTPGHTLGSMCYIINDKYLFTGDILSLKDKKVELSDSYFNMDDKVAEKSIRKLATLQNINYIFTAHYGYTDNFKKAFERWKVK